MQKATAKKLCQLSEKYLVKNSKILDLGAGTGFISSNLLASDKSYQIFETDISLNMLKNREQKSVNIFPFNSDIERLPIKEKPIFDAVFSSFSLQWINDLDKLFKTIDKITKPNAIVAFCLPLKKTLEEIQISSDNSNCNLALQKFHDLDFVKNKLQKSNFLPEVIESELVKRKYENSVACLKEIKIIGANYFAKKNLLNKKKLKDFNDFFFKNYNNIASWNIAFLIYKKI